MNFISLDLSLTESGVIVEENGEIILKEVIKPKKLSGTKRLNYIVKEIKRIITSQEIHYAFIEGGGLMSKKAFSLGELHGAVKSFLMSYGYKIVIIPPTTIKKHVTGKGNSAKDLMIKSVYKKYGFDEDNNNIVDAYALLKTGEYALFEKTKSAAELLKKIIQE